MVQSEVFNVSYGYPREQLALSVHRKKKKQLEVILMDGSVLRQPYPSFTRVLNFVFG